MSGQILNCIQKFRMTHVDIPGMLLRVRVCIDTYASFIVR